MNTAMFQFVSGICMKMYGEGRVNTATRILNLGIETKWLD
jgi:hypothetical protein